MANPSLFFVYFNPFLHHKSITNWKKRRWSAWDLNLGPQDGRCRQNHGAMAATYNYSLLTNALEMGDIMYWRSVYCIQVYCTLYASILHASILYTVCKYTVSLMYFFVSDKVTLVMLYFSVVLLWYTKIGR